MASADSSPAYMFLSFMVVSFGGGLPGCEKNRRPLGVAA
jgi:hypothetical protein